MHPENFELICRNIQRNLTILAYKLDLVRMSFGIEVTLEGHRVSEEHLIQKARKYSPESFSGINAWIRTVLNKPRVYNRKFQKYEQIVRSACKELDKLYLQLQEKTVQLKVVTRAQCPDSLVELLKDVNELYSQVNGTFPVVHV